SGGVVGAPVGGHAGGGAVEELAAALVPHLFIDGTALFRRDRASRPLGSDHRESAGGRARPFVALVVAALDVVEEGLVDGAVARWDGVLRRTLKHVEVARLLRDDGDGLHAAGPGANDPDALVGEVDTIVGPGAGVVCLTRECFA